MFHYALSELEALGDDLALDEDTSYLDEVPAPADTIPGENDNTGTKTQVWNDYSFSLIYSFSSCITKMYCSSHMIHNFSRKKEKNYKMKRLLAKRVKRLNDYYSGATT